MLDVLEKCYAEDATSLSFKEASLMESYLSMQMVSVGANYELYRIGVVDKAAWQRSTVAVSQLLASQWARCFRNNQKKWLDESFVREVEEGLATHDHSDYLELIRSGQ